MALDPPPPAWLPLPPSSSLHFDTTLSSLTDGIATCKNKTKKMNVGTWGNLTRAEVSVFRFSLVFFLLGMFNVEAHAEHIYLQLNTYICIYIYMCVSAVWSKVIFASCVSYDTSIARTTGIHALSNVKHDHNRKRKKLYEYIVLRIIYSICLLTMCSACSNRTQLYNIQTRETTIESFFFRDAYEWSTLKLILLIIGWQA